MSSGDHTSLDLNLEPLDPRKVDDFPFVSHPVGLTGLGKKERDAMKSKLKEQLQHVSSDTIRRNRMKYSDAICLELDENGYCQSAKFIRDFIQLNDEIRRQHGKDSPVWGQPLLKNSKPELDVLRQGLQETEDALRAGMKPKQNELMLNIATHFAELPESWWWLAEQLFTECVELSVELKIDGGKHEAKTRFLFGKFLFFKLKDPVMARQHLKLSREHSMGKNWPSPESKTITLFEASCILLVKVLLVIATAERLADPLKAVRTCVLALKRAKDAKADQITCDVLMLMGLCNIDANELATALRNLEKYLELSKNYGQDVNICQGHIHLALVYTKLENMRVAEEHLLESLRFAEEKMLDEQIGITERYMGEFYLNQGLTKNSEEHLMRAFNIFMELRRSDELEETRCLLAIAKATGLWNGYVNLLTKCGSSDKNMTNVSSLCNWKGHRKEFADEKNNLVVDIASIFTTSDRPLSELTSVGPKMKPRESHISKELSNEVVIESQDYPV